MFPSLRVVLTSVLWGTHYRDIRILFPDLPLFVSARLSPVSSHNSPLDGLNKQLGAGALKGYQAYFARLSAQQSGVAVNFDRPYIVQVARFDPSKGMRCHGGMGWIEKLVNQSLTPGFWTWLFFLLQGFLSFWPPTYLSAKSSSI